jgi:hypothetical protein
MSTDASYARRISSPRMKSSLISATNTQLLRVRRPMVSSTRASFFRTIQHQLWRTCTCRWVVLVELWSYFLHNYKMQNLLWLGIGYLRVLIKETNTIRKKIIVLYIPREPGSSVSLATGWTTERSMFDPRQRRKDFSSSLSVQTGTGAHPASCTMGTGGSFPGAKTRPGRDADHSPASTAEVENV